MMAGTGVSVGGAGMLRTRRRDVSVKPNRKLDRKSSRGMIYENEELRLRTIHINAEVEQGQNDIKKLRRENEQLRREIWSLRDEYDKLEEILKRQKSRGESEEYEDRSDEDDGLQSDYSCEEEEDKEFDETKDNDEETTEELNKEEHLENFENQKISSEKMTSSIHRLHVDFDDLSVVDEEEELKKDKERKDTNLSEEAQRQKEGTKSPPPLLRPRQLHENIPFYPATYEPSNTFSSSSYYTECPFEFPSTVDLMLPADTPALLASSCSRLHPGDPVIPLGSLEAPSLEPRVGVTDQLLPQIHVPPVGWQSNVVLPSKQLPNYQTMGLTTTAVSSPGMHVFGASDPRVCQNTGAEEQQHFSATTSCQGFSNVPSLLQRRKGSAKNFFEGKAFEDLRGQYSNSDKIIVANGWSVLGDETVAEKIAGKDEGRGEEETQRTENKNVEGIFTFEGSEKPKHFFAPLPSKVRRQVDEESPTTNLSHFGTGNSSSSGKTGSTVISKSPLAAQKGSADIYVNGAVPYEENLQREREEQRTFLSTDNLLIFEDKSNAGGQLVKSMSCQDLSSELQSLGMSQQLKVSQNNGKQQMFTQSDNTLDNISGNVTSKPYKTHLNVTLKMPRINQTVSPDTPEIPKLPTIDYRLFNNPFLRTFDPTCRNYANQRSPVTRPLSVQVNDDNLCYYPNPVDVPAFGRGVSQLDERYRTLQAQSDQNRLLIPSNQLISGQLLSPANKHDIQVTSFERPSPHTFVPPATPYDLNVLRRLNTNPYLQNRNLYQNVPFVPRGSSQLFQQRHPIRTYYENLALKVPAQTQTSIDGDSHQEDDRALSLHDEESLSTPSSPSGNRRKKTTKKEKSVVAPTGPGKDQKPLSPAAQRRLKKQSSVTSSETPESPGKVARKKPRKLSVTTTTTSEVQEDKNESRSSSSGQDSPRKDQTRRVSLYFNAKKRPSLTSVKTARSGSLDTPKDKYAEGLMNSERERTNSISSRETNTTKARKASTSSGNVPWCACWGNGCI